MPGASGWSYDWGYHELETPDKWEHVTEDGTALTLFLISPNEGNGAWGVFSRGKKWLSWKTAVCVEVAGIDFNLSSREQMEALADQIDFSVF